MNKPSSTSYPHGAIAALRASRGETLEAFGTAIGMASKSKVSELERGVRPATAEQALAIEALSGGAIDAAALNELVRLSRQPALPLRVVTCAACDLPVDSPDAAACGNADCPRLDREAA